MPGGLRNMATALFWCKIPFTYGNVRTERQEVASSRELSGVVECAELGGEETQMITEEEEEEARGGETQRTKEEAVGAFAESTNFDGLISSIQMLITLVVTAAVVILPSYMTHADDASYRRLLLTALMGLGLGLMVCMHRCRTTFLQPEPPSADRAQGKTGHSDRDNLTSIGIVTFCFLGCLYNIVRVVDLLSCSGEWILCQRRNMVATQILKVFYYAVRIIYLAGQTVFCLLFNRSTFSDKSLTRHALMFLLAINVIFWFQEMISEAGHMLTHDDKYQHKHTRLVQMCFANDTNHTAGLLHCMGNYNNTMYRYVRRYAVPILRPFLIEYSLLIGECLVHWFIGCGGETDQNNSEPVIRGGTGHPSTAGSIHSITHREGSQIEEDVNPAVDTGDEVQVSGHDSEAEDDERTPLLRGQFVSSDGSRSLMLLLCLGSAVICNLLLFVFAFLPKLLRDVGDESLSKTIEMSCYYYTTFNYSLMMICVALGYGFSSQFKVKSRAPFTGLDYLLIFTSLGPIAICAFALQATLWAKTSDAMISAYRATSFIEVIQSGIQVTFVLYAGRIRVDNGTVTATRRNLFRAIVFYLALCNGSLWCVHTFSAGSLGSHYLEEHFGATGRGIILIVLVPLSLFFRFNSCLLFARIFVQTSSKRQKRQRRRK